MAALLGIDASEGGGGALTEQDPLACLLGKGAGKGISVCHAPETLLKPLHELVDVHGFASFSKYLNREINERLTSSSRSAWEGWFVLGLSLKTPYST